MLIALFGLNIIDMYDLAIIGAGAAGIEAAKTALKKGLKTVLIEKSPDCFGGTCLNRGCIPSKLYLNLVKQGKSLEEIFTKKNEVVKEIKRSAISNLERQGAEFKWGEAVLAGDREIRINTQNISAKNIILATGSVPRRVIEPDGKKIIFAEDIFSFSTLPVKFLIVGAGSVGIEIASFLNNLSKEVHVVEKEEEILPGFEETIAQRFRMILERKGIRIKTSTSFSECNLDNYDMVILACGRIANTEGLGAENLDIEMQPENRRIKTGDYMRTNIDNIYACGDITTTRMFAYIAEYQARISVENIVGDKVKPVYRGIADCVFSSPQIAKIGIGEEESRRLNLNYRVLRTNFMRFSSSYAYNDTDGFMKILFDGNNKILGATIISQLACELINIFSLSIRHNLSLDILKESVFIHPTFSEIIPIFLRDL